MKLRVVIQIKFNTLTELSPNHDSRLIRRACNLIINDIRGDSSRNSIDLRQKKYKSKRQKNEQKMRYKINK